MSWRTKRLMGRVAHMFASAAVVVLVVQVR